MNIIGITGSSGTGKTTICNILEKEYNIKLINVDIIAKGLSKKGSEYINEIVDKFGKDIVDENGELKRRKLGEIIYSDVDKRLMLNNCTFKYIKEEIMQIIRKLDVTEIKDFDVHMCKHVAYCTSQGKLTLLHTEKSNDFSYAIKKEQNSSTIVIEAPLLFESNLNEICDVVFGIISEKEIQIKRIMERDNIEYEYAKMRIDAQASNDFYIQNCDEIIVNNGDISIIKEKIENLAKKYNITKRLQ